MIGRSLKSGDQCVAVLTVYDTDRMTARGRRDVVTWLLRKAKELQSNKKGFFGRTRFRYLYRVN